MDDLVLLRPYSILPWFKNHKDVYIYWYPFLREKPILPYSGLINGFSRELNLLGYDETIALEKVLRWDYQANTYEEQRRIEYLLYSMAYVDELFSESEVRELVEFTKRLGINLFVDEHYIIPIDCYGVMPFSFLPDDENNGRVYYDSYNNTRLSIPVCGYYDLKPYSQLSPNFYPIDYPGDFNQEVRQ